MAGKPLALWSSVFSRMKLSQCWPGSISNGAFASYGLREVPTVSKSSTITESLSGIILLPCLIFVP
jgi:hypothetical protein